MGTARTLDTSREAIAAGLVHALEGERSALQLELAARRRELAFLATHDALTALPNRTLVFDRAERLLVRSRSRREVCGALFIDLDGFQVVNDGLGHGAGDELLVAVADRLLATVPGADTIGRLGDDEFVVLLDESALMGGPDALAERLLLKLAEPFTLGAANNFGRVALSASIGIALGDRLGAAELLRDADIALYRAKLEGRNRYLVFEPGMQDAAWGRMQLEMGLREAVAHHGFELVYQPILDLQKMAPVRMEALLRWPRPDSPEITPAEFIPVLEESGLISEVGRWVLREACRECAGWISDGLDIGVAVNVSALQMESDRYVDDVAVALADSGLSPDKLTIEITESALMRDAQRAGDRLWAIKRLGVRLSIDDFGTGYSSLSYLQHFPVDELKIDGSFVAQLDGAPHHDALIRTFVQLGRSLDLDTIAEGIEDQSQLELLQAHHCATGQGFLFARPLNGERCRALLHRWSASPAGPAALDPEALELAAAGLEVPTPPVRRIGRRAAA